jgi:hypothetical protein
VKKKAILFSLLLSMVFVISGTASLVAADKTDGQWVSASLLAGMGPTITTPGDVMTTDAGVIQYRDMSTVRSGSVLTIGDTNYPVYSRDTWDAAFNPNTKVLVRHDDAIWYISADGSPDGFAGNIEAKAFDFNPVIRRYSRVEDHCLLQGFGTFAGQTLMMSYDGPGGPGHSWTGFSLLK